MDTANRRPQLPALSYLDIDKAKREEEEPYQNRNAVGPQTHSSAPAASPSYQYSSAGPPAYNHLPPQHANSWPGVKPGVHTPPDSRRTSGDEHETAKQTTRQSLPSISEALGVDSQTAYQSAPATQPPSQSTHLPQPQSAAPSSPSLNSRRPYGMEPPPPHNPYATNSTYQYPTFRQDSAAPQPYSTPDSAKPAYTPSQDSRPPLHLQTSQPPRTQQPSSYSNSSSTSPQYEQQSSHSAGPMGPPSFPYGYTPYPPRYTQPSSTSGHSAGPIYQPSSQYAAPQTPSSSWKSESGASRFGTDDRSTAPTTYGESVKRHLDLYDIEAALNDIAASSSILMDFSRRYGDRMHQNARNGPTLSTLPSPVEVDDMIGKGRSQLDALHKIREVILAHQAAYEQQMADQRQQHKPFHDTPQQDHHQDGEDVKGGFAGVETKKRRGRAAPPGRCHSCNRAETPEWRRGPDGARTLCNACGLHYAKLTRKQTGANKPSMGSSNLRPKEA